MEGPVIASDGTVYSASKIQATETSLFTFKADSTWRYWRNLKKSKRKSNDGWISYESKSLMGASDVKKMTIRDMCRY